MGALFANVLSQIIPTEGVDSNVREDRGGLTKFGISKRQYPELDIANLTFDDAAKIYKRDYWDVLNLSKINSQTVANKIFFIYINASPAAVIQRVQIAANACAPANADILKVDGVFGDKTILAINRCPEFWLLDRLRTEFCWMYLGIIDKDKTQEKFLNGWIRRALK